jgi:hypothetical protein
MEPPRRESVTSLKIVSECRTVMQPISVERGVLLNSGVLGGGLFGHEPPKVSSPQKNGSPLGADPLGLNHIAMTQHSSGNISFVVRFVRVFDLNSQVHY